MSKFAKPITIENIETSLEFVDGGLITPGQHSGDIAWRPARKTVPEMGGTSIEISGNFRIINMLKSNTRRIAAFSIGRYTIDPELGMAVSLDFINRKRYSREKATAHHVESQGFKFMGLRNKNVLYQDVFDKVVDSVARIATSTEVSRNYGQIMQRYDNLGDIKISPEPNQPFVQYINEDA